MGTVTGEEYQQANAKKKRRGRHWSLSDKISQQEEKEECGRKENGQGQVTRVIQGGGS